MTKIAGIKFIKSSKGKITHATLSLKHHSEYLNNLIDLNEMDKARKGDTIDWEDAKKELLQVIKRKKNDV